MDWLEEITPEEANDRIAKGQVILIDVREVNEFAQARIPGALLHPLSEFDPAALPCSPDRPVLFHCAGGKRSAMAAEQYRAHVGCDQVTHIAGGIGAWIQSGLPVKQADAG